MAATNFDTLTYAKKLQEAGFTAQQAEAQAEALRAVVDENLATKRDIEEVRREIELVRRDMKEMENSLRRDMKEMEDRLLLRMELMRRDIIVWLGGLIVIATTALAVLMKLP